MGGVRRRWRRVPLATVLAGIALSATSCSQEYDVAVGLDGGSIVIVVPTCMGDVASVELVTRHASSDGLSSTTIWRIQALTPDERPGRFMVGTQVAGFATTHPLADALPAIDGIDFAVDVVPVEPSAPAGTAFGLHQLREGELLFDGGYGDVDDFERSSPCGESFSVLRNIVVPVLLIFLAVAGLIAVVVTTIVSLLERRSQRR